MDAQQDQVVTAPMSRRQHLAARLAQALVLAYAVYRLLRVNVTEQGINALAWSVPWAILIIVAILMIPVLIRLGWRRFGRMGPAWAIATVVCTSTWGIATVFVWLVVGIALILSD